MPKVVCIGGSTGAPAGLVELLKALPGDFPAPILVALHMPGAMTASYAKSVQGKTPFRLVVAENNAHLDPGSVYLGPGGMHIGLARNGRVVVSEKPQETFFKPSIDVLFYTAARAVGSSVVAVVLTGLSARKDAVEGAVAIKKSRGNVIVLDDPTSKFLGMPKNVIDAGAATHVAPLADLPKQLTQVAR